MIWDEGKEIHGKWQKRFWDIGRLGGNFYCQSCHFAWGAVAPEECENCHASRQFLRYMEVPLQDRNRSLAGHADGLDDDAVIEIKSIGVNSLRFEAPILIKQHSHKFQINGKSREFLDYDGLWDSIRIPFATHIRQGDLYCYMGGYSICIFIYECKWNQRTKEMIVKYRPERIAGLLQQCSDIHWALQGRAIPVCPFGGCADCERYEEKDERPPVRRRLNIRRPSQDHPQATVEPSRNGAQAGRRRLSRDAGRGAEES